MDQISINSRCKSNIKWVLNEKKFEVADLVKHENQTHWRKGVGEKKYLENRWGKGHWKNIYITSTYFSISAFIMHLLLRSLTAPGNWVRVNWLTPSGLVFWMFLFSECTGIVWVGLFLSGRCDVLISILAKLLPMEFHKGSRTLDLVGFPALSHSSCAPAYLINLPAWNSE